MAYLFVPAGMIWYIGALTPKTAAGLSGAALVFLANVNVARLAIIALHPLLLAMVMLIVFPVTALRRKTQ